MVIALASAAAGSVACSLLVDTGDLAGSSAPPGADAATADATAADTGSTPADASDDGRIAEAAPDAPFDAGTPCVGAGWFCDDFEGVVGAKWSSKDVSGGTVTHVGGARNGAFAMQAQVDALAGVNYANLVVAPPAVPSRIACDLDVKVTDLPSNGEIDVIDFVTRAGAVKQSLYLASFDGVWGVYEYTDKGGGNVVDRGQPSPLGPVTGQWTHVRFETDFATLSMTIDGMPAQPLTGITPVTASTRSISLGITYASGAQSASLLVDDLVCALAP